MQVNYQLKMEEILASIKGTPKLLLHSCCAPCSSYVIEYLSKYFEIYIYYYNPNISPIEEYEKRKNEEKRFIETFPSENKLHIIDCDYDNQKYEDLVKGMEEEKEGGNRCFLCYNLRMEQTAKVAEQNNFDYFGTTLSVSPYKNSAKINEIGSLLEQKYNIKFLYADFKKKDGYKRSIELSKEYNLYRQDYCGCKYSKRERNVKYEVCE